MPHLREITPADVDAVLALRVATRENRVTLEELREVYGVTPASLAEALQADARGWLIEADGRLAAFAIGERATGEVQVVAVRPDCEGRGFGKAVLAAVVDWLFAEGHAALWLLANPDPAVRATGFYRRLGWRPTAERKGDDVVLRLERGAR